MFVSADGFVSGPNGEVDWVFRSGDDATDEWIVENLWQAGLLAMGSRSYYEMATYWPSADTPFAAPMNEIPKVVFTRKGLIDTPSGQTSAVNGSWANPFVASGDLVDEVARLKAQPGKDIRALGGASFAQNLAAHGLIDDTDLWLLRSPWAKGYLCFPGCPNQSICNS